MHQRSRGFGSSRPPMWVGLLATAAAVASATLVIYPLKAVTAPVGLSVVYLPGVLLVSAYWGVVLGLVCSLASALAFNFFHIPPTGLFTIADSRNWVALVAFTFVAVVVSTIANVARSRALEAERGRAEATLAATLARELLAGARTESALGNTAHRVASALAIPSVSLRLGVHDAGVRQRALPLHGSDGARIATLLVPAATDAEVMERLRRTVVPALEVLVAVALHRDAVQADAVETAALRRSDELKTALLRSVSHDLRTPVTSILTAAHALMTPSLTPDERGELSAAVVEEGERLSGLIDKLLDLSRLQAGRATPRTDWVSLEEVLLSARDRLAGGGPPVHLEADHDLPALRGDAAQLEQVFVNLLENARRYAGDAPVTVRAHRFGSRVVVRVIDHGPGIAPADRERIFEPFYRGHDTGPSRWTGSGLGLAIARGFVQANGGTITVESLPGQGTTFVVELPLPDGAAIPA